MMPLSEKGRFAPRPTLPHPAESVARIVEAWPEIHARTHWQLGDESIVDGADFYVGERELGHLHLYPETHIVLPETLHDAVIAAKLARPFRWSERFVMQRVRSEVDAELVVWLFRLAYDHLRGTRLATLRARVEERAAAARPARESARTG